MLLNRRGLMIAATQAPAGSGGGGVSTIWDAANSSAFYTLSNANLTATLASGHSDQIVRATTGHSGTGDWSFTITMSNFSSTLIGLVTSATPSADFIGDGTDSIGWQINNTIILRGGSTVATTSTSYVETDTVTIRLKNGKLYVAKNGTYALGDPVAQTGGYDVSAMGTLYPACSSNNTQAFTANFTNW